MSNPFFSRFPTIQYNMDGQGSFLELTNIVKNVDVNDVYSNESTYYTFHEIYDGERPDTISYRLYGTPNYYWTFFILNNDLRAGLNNAWPLSSQQLEHMIAREYDGYSVITFLPANGTTITGLSNSGLMNLVYFWEAYLPYLRLTNEGGSEWAKVLRYDTQLLQLIIYDIEKTHGSGPVTSIDTFINNPRFKLTWHNPFDSESEDEDEVAKWVACNNLRKEFLDKMIDVYGDFDTAAEIDPSRYEGATTEEIAVAIDLDKSNYIFGKLYVSAGSTYSWASYRNAASEYFEEIDDVKYSRSAYDIVTNTNIISPDFISFTEKEELINARKEKIRVVRADKIAEFAAVYFNTLNNVR